MALRRWPIPQRTRDLGLHEVRVDADNGIAAPRAEVGGVVRLVAHRNDVPVDRRRELGRGTEELAGDVGSVGLEHDGNGTRPLIVRAGATLATSAGTSVSAPSAPRFASSSTASRTCVASGPESTARSRATSCTRTRPTAVGLPAAPHGPSPRSAAESVVIVSAGTVARSSGGILHGSINRSAVEMIAGRSISACTQPSSCSQRRCRVVRLRLRWRTPVANGRSNSSGELGADLAGVGVDRVAPDDDEIERPLALECSCQRLRCRERVGPGEGRVGDQHAVGRNVGGSPPGDGLAQRVVGARRPEGEHRHCSVADRGRELDRLRDRAPAVRVHLEVDPVAPEPPVVAELHLFESRDLLDQSSDAHGRGRVP